MPAHARLSFARLIAGGLLCLFAVSHVQSAPAAGAELELPVCNAEQPETKLIRARSDWESINDPNYRIFCVFPGNYQSLGRLRLSAKGSADKPRYLMLVDDTQDHPVRQSESARVVVSGLEVRGSWWVIDRLTIRGTKSFITFGGDDNVLSRSLVEGGGGGAGQINLGTGDRTIIRGNVLRETVQRANRDSHCIKATEFTQGIRLIDNEIYNCAGDGLQIKSSSGMLIENNDFYATPDLYSDCSGELDRDGDCACAENGIDIKGTISGEPAPEDWVRINNNRFWGFRRTDTHCGGTGSGGYAISVHFKGAYVSIEGNVFFDLGSGFSTPNEAAHDIDLLDNLFYLVADSAIAGLRKSTRNRIVGNTMIETGSAIDAGGRSHEFFCNVFISAGEVVTNERADFNAYYGSDPATDLGRHDLVYPSVTSARNAPRRFIIRRLTVPALVTIPNAVTTEKSPHYRICGEEFRPG